jgi:multiple sugar transport system substrate-binding protein
VVQAGVQRRAVPYGVRVLVGSSATDRDLYEALRGDFNAAHDDIFVENDFLDDVSGSHGYDQRLRADLAAGTAADVVAFGGRSWQRYAVDGALHPLNEFAARESWTAPWPDSDGYDAQTRFRGKLYLSPASAGPLVVYFLKEPFDRAGIPYPKPDWTYVEFQDLCRRLTRTVGRVMYGYQWNSGYLRNAPWWRMNSQLEWDRIADPTKSRWNTPAVIEALQFQLYDSQYKLQISPTVGQLADPTAAVRLEAGGSAMKSDGPWFLATVAAGPDGAPRAGFDVQVLPRGRAAKTPHVCSLHGLVITKMSKDKEASWEAVKWVCGAPGQGRAVEAGRLPATPDAARKLWLPSVARRYGIVNGEAFVRAMELSTTSLAGELSEDVLRRDSGLGRAIDDIRDGIATAKDALDQVQPAVQRVLDAYWATQTQR